MHIRPGRRNTLWSFSMKYQMSNISLNSQCGWCILQEKKESPVKSTQSSANWDDIFLLLSPIWSSSRRIPFREGDIKCDYRWSMALFIIPLKDQQWNIHPYLMARENNGSADGLSLWNKKDCKHFSFCEKLRDCKLTISIDFIYLFYI